jgi:lysophospholipase L1-like esterase
LQKVDQLSWAQTPKEKLIMQEYSRRRFLSTLGAAAALFVTARTGLSFVERDENFAMLVVGDSLVWGQGLDEKDKFYNLVKNWLQSELGKNVDLKVKAHSGARLNLQEFETKALEEAERDETAEYHPEINLWFPSISAQIAAAQKEYRNPADVKLIMLSGSITDIDTGEILNPFGDNKKLRADITKFCYQEMFQLLERSARAFPEAQMVVVGYFPILSKDTRTDKMFNAFLELSDFPRPLKPLANNVIVRQFFKLLKKKSLRRSRIWFEDSNRCLSSAVARLNDKSGRQRAVFVKSPLTEANAFETSETFLFRVQEKGRVNDSFYNERLEKCGTVLDELKKIGLKQSVRRCQVAALGHPDPTGAKAYAKAIKDSLKPLLPSLYRARPD